MISLVIFVLSIVIWKQSEALIKPVDLGRVVEEESLRWYRTTRFVFTKKFRESTAILPWLAYNDFATGEHISTHIDAPFLLNKDGWKVGDIPLKKLIGPGICIDLRHKDSAAKAYDTLTIFDILRWEAKHGNIKKGSIVLVNFGWGKYYGTRKYYFDENIAERLSFPGISKGAIELLAKKEIAGIGLDTPSSDSGASSSFIVQQTLAEHNIFGLENLDLSANLPERGYNIIAMPMNIREGSGAPARVIAVPQFEKDD